MSSWREMLWHDVLFSILSHFNPLVLFGHFWLKIGMERNLVFEKRSNALKAFKIYEFKLYFQVYAHKVNKWIMTTA